MCMIIVVADLKVVRWRTPAAGQREAHNRCALPAAGQGESGEPNNSLDRNSPEEPQKQTG